METILNLFSDINTNPAKYLISSSGKEFENCIASQLENFGCDKTSFKSVGVNYKNYFKSIIENDQDIIENETFFEQHYIDQPFGSQQYPDFLIFGRRFIFCLELKFVKSNATKPVWNSGLPRDNGLYIFASYGRRDITFFRGCDILHNKDREILKGFFDKELERSELFNEEHMSDQEFGFATYARKAYDQKRKHNPDAIINFFKNHKRLHLESSLLDYLSNLNE